MGIPAEYVLFDSCFSSPKMFWQLKQLGLDSVGMLKRTKKAYYRYRGRLYDVKGLYERLATSKMRQKEDYLYSSVVEAEYQGHVFQIRLVYVTKRGGKGKYLVLATTQYKLRSKSCTSSMTSGTELIIMSSETSRGLNLICWSFMTILNKSGPQFTPPI
ncbi:hypothetical protein DM475_07550 [Lactobacillus helveticus]|uniref:Transposase n=2 Tax=Lactobacillus helveticus TaxID=1587 RepID=A0AAV4E727_LACHE|nr:transposase IS4 family protein [Lactobacillus helveticus MTCC 5463]KXN78743.1 hypothetical protein AY471_09180 [Lactobacillus helveticus]MBW8063866.1 hypothetical protein [Lactobacillus helveticus]MCT3407275.1 hypothetical protein [Lactobacillus helveticus]PAW06417.1 hypothetical protein CKG09_07385 [Lactobacillus helveticus]